MKKFLEKWYEDKGPKWCANKLNTNYSSVKQCAHSMGLNYARSRRSNFVFWLRDKMIKIVGGKVPCVSFSLYSKRAMAAYDWMKPSEDGLRLERKWPVKWPVKIT